MCCKDTNFFLSRSRIFEKKFTVYWFQRHTTLGRHRMAWARAVNPNIATNSIASALQTQLDKCDKTHVQSAFLT